MKRKVFLAMLIAAALVLGLTGCPTEDEGKNGKDPDDGKFNYTPWVGTWTVIGTNVSGNYVLLENLPPEAVNQLNTLELKVNADGTFVFKGQLTGIGFITATGELVVDPDEKTSFIITPKQGVLDMGGTDVEVEESMLGSYKGYINRVLESNGNWKTTSEDVKVFDHLWAHKK